MLSSHSDISMFMQEMNITNTKFLKLVSLSLFLSLNIHTKGCDHYKHMNLSQHTQKGCDYYKHMNPQQPLASKEELCKSTSMVDLRISNDIRQFSFDRLLCIYKVMHHFMGITTLCLVYQHTTNTVKDSNFTFVT